MRLPQHAALMLAMFCLAPGCAPDRPDIREKEEQVAAPVADLAPAFTRAATRRADDLRRTREGDPLAALDLIELGEWNAMARVSPFDPPLISWRERDEEIAPGIALRQVWGELAANWAVRQHEMPAPARADLMRQARTQLERDGTRHPILLHELAWLYEEVAPQDTERARLLKLKARTLLTQSPLPTDGGIAAHRLLLQSELVEDYGTCLALLSQASEDHIDDPLMRIEAIRRWIDISDHGRSSPQLDVPIAQRKGMFGSRTGGSRRKVRDQRLVRWESACTIATRCGDPATEGRICWEAATWAEAHRELDHQADAQIWARSAALAFTRAGNARAAAEAEALFQILTALTDYGIDWPARRAYIEGALLALGNGPSLARARLCGALGVTVHHLDDQVAADDAFALAVASMPDPGRGPLLVARCWLDLAHAAAKVGADPGPIHERAITAWAKAAKLLRDEHQYSVYAVAQQEVARFIWDDGPEMRREAETAFREAADALGRLGPHRWQDEEELWLELATRLRVAGDVVRARLVLLDAADLWRERVGNIDDRDERVRRLEEHAGLTAADENAIDPARNRTQGRAAAILSDTIAGLATTSEHRERDLTHLLIKRLVGWPPGKHSLEQEHRDRMARDCHLNQMDCRLLAESALRADDSQIMQIIGAIGHPPLAPLLAESLAEAKRGEGTFGHAAAKAFSLIAAEDRTLAGRTATIASDLTWGDACTAVIAEAAQVLSPLDFTAFCRDLLLRSQGENRGILTHLINILARDPAQLPVADLRRLALTAQWHDDRNEALWALSLVDDPGISEVVAQMLLDPRQSLTTRGLALQIATRLRSPGCGPAILALLKEHDPDSDDRFLEADGLTAAMALGLPVDEALLRRWASGAWGDDPDPASLAMEGPWERYRILSANLALWLLHHEPAAWDAMNRGIGHSWRRYRCHLITAAADTAHPRAFATIMAIADHDGLLLPGGRDDQRSVYLDALSHLPLTDDQRRAAEERFGHPVPPPVPLPSPRFDEATRPCDGGPSAPLP